MDIKELRAAIETALANEGLEKKKLFKKGLKVWALPGDEVIRFFSLHGYRRPWGFVVDGFIGLEIPALRRWLDEFQPGDRAGIFQSCFTGYHTANDDVLGDFMVEHGTPIPADLWAGLISDRLRGFPDQVDKLVLAYRGNKERLGWLAHPSSRHAWEFLVAWGDAPDPSLHVPQRMPDGRIG